MNNQIGKHCTNIREEGGMTRVRYHNTDVVSFNEEEIILNTGGWSTATTKTRMNQAASQFGLRFKVIQSAFDWFIKLANGDTLHYQGNLMRFPR